MTSIQSPLQTKASAYQQQEQGDIRAAIDLWNKAIALSPNDSSFDRALYRDALAVQDYKTAYTAVQAVLRLEPDAPDKKQLESLAKQLKPLTQINTSGSTGTAGP